MAPHEIRLVGDPVLRTRCPEVTEIDGALARLANDMITTMYEAPGVGLAANQVGVQKRLFVYDIQDGNELSVEGEELLARVFQHETDHLDGVLLLERLDEEQQREAKRELRDRQLASTAGAEPPARRRLRLPGRSPSA